MEGEVWAQLVSTTDALSDPIPIIEKSFTIGRGRGADLSLAGNQMISSKHCTIECGKGDKIYLIDTSTNGTLLNLTTKIQRKKHQISHGDELHLIYKKNDPSLNVAYMFQVLSELEAEEHNATLEESSDTVPDESLEDYSVQDDSFDTALNDDIDTGDASKKRRLSEEISENKKKKPSEKNVSPKKEDPVKECGNEMEKSTSDEKDVGDKKSEKPAAATDNKCDTGAESSAADDTIEETLMCVICQEIMHDCISLQPCMHSFCAGCYSDWMPKSQDCPTCRLKVERINKNHIVNNLIEAFLNKHPQRRRPKADIDELNEKNKITNDMLYPPRTYVDEDSEDEDDDDGLVPPEGHGEGSSSSSGQSDSDDGIPLPVHSFNMHGYTTTVGRVTHTGLRAPGFVCRSCPTYVRPVLIAVPHIRKNIPSVDAFQCRDDTPHLLCQCCLQAMPDRNAHRLLDPTIPKQSCEHCHKVLCHSYWGCQKTAVPCQGCLTELKNLPVLPNCLNTILLENVHESQLLQTYLVKKGLTLHTFFQHCLRHHIKENTLGVNENSTLCNQCGMKVFREMAYKYRLTIPLNEFTAEVRSDCHWGRNCRSQKNNYQHTRKFNHICEQTRFA